MERQPVRVTVHASTGVSVDDAARLAVFLEKAILEHNAKLPIREQVQVGISLTRVDEATMLLVEQYRFDDAHYDTRPHSAKITIT